MLSCLSRRRRAELTPDHDTVSTSHSRMTLRAIQASQASLLRRRSRCAGLELRSMPSSSSSLRRPVVRSRTGTPSTSSSRSRTLSFVGGRSKASARLRTIVRRCIHRPISSIADPDSTLQGHRWYSPLAPFIHVLIAISRTRRAPSEWFSDPSVFPPLTCPPAADQTRTSSNQVPQIECSDVHLDECAVPLGPLQIRHCSSYRNSRRIAGPQSTWPHSPVSSTSKSELAV